LGKYSIKDLEFLSGIKAHTLRVWEQRYKILEPKRSETNIRYYSDDDLKYLLNISLLYGSNFKISQIARWTRDEVANKVYELSENTYDHNSQINALTISMIEMDEERFEKVVNTNILQQGFEKTMTNLVHPFLKKIGILWQTGAINPAHEHFISNLIRQKLFVAIDGQMVPTAGNTKKYLLFLPEGETHEIGLLFANFILKSRQNRVVYLGTNVPLSDVKDVYDFHNPDYLLSIFTSKPTGDEIQDYVNELSSLCSEATVLLSGFQCFHSNLEAPSNGRLLNSFEELMNFAWAPEDNPSISAK
jgi:DNA-binding transcriptional MerR regulator